MPPESLLIRQTRRPTSSGGGCPDKVVSRAIAGCSSAGIRNRVVFQGRTPHDWGEIRASSAGRLREEE
jgi:hypothetical protein